LTAFKSSVQNALQINEPSLLGLQAGRLLVIGMVKLGDFD